MKIFKYNSSGSWEEVPATLNYQYTPKSSSSTVDGTISAVTLSKYNAGALFSVQPNTLYKIIFNANITSAKFNPVTTTGQGKVWYYLAADYGLYPKATTIGPISRLLVDGKTEITVTTPANATHMVFSYVNNAGTASNPAYAYFNTRLMKTSGFISGWGPAPANKMDNGSWTDGEVYISTNNVWIN